MSAASGERRAGARNEHRVMTTRAARLRAVWVRRVRRAPIRYTDRYGLTYRLHPTDDLELYFRHHGWFEVGEQEFCRRYLRPGMTAVDVGAYIGMYSCLMASLVGPTGRVHAFEPSPEAFERLGDSIRLNRLTNVVANRCVVFSGRATLPLFLYGPPFQSLNSVVHGALQRGGALMRPQSEIVAETVSLDGYCAEHAIDRIDFLKLDAEGAELEVVTGAARLLGRAAIRALLLEVGVGAARVRERLEAFGFRFFAVERDGSLTRAPADGVLRAANVVALHA
jgi:FkbM family methyltransferase